MSKGLLNISYIIVIITSYYLHHLCIIFPPWEGGINTHLHWLPKVPQGDK